MLRRLRWAAPVVLGVVLFASVAAAQDVAASAADASLDNPLAFVKVISHAVQERAWGTVAAGVLVLLVALLRTFGRKVHDYIPDDTKNPILGFVESSLAFLYDTKPGGWLLNTLFSAGGGFGVVLLAGEPVTWQLARSIVEVSFTAAGMWGALKDFNEWRNARKDAKSNAPAPEADPKQP